MAVLKGSLLVLLSVVEVVRTNAQVVHRSVSHGLELNATISSV